MIYSYRPYKVIRGRTKTSTLRWIREGEAPRDSISPRRPTPFTTPPWGISVLQPTFTATVGRAVVPSIPPRLAIVPTAAPAVVLPDDAWIPSSTSTSSGREGKQTKTRRTKKRLGEDWEGEQTKTRRTKKRLGEDCGQCKYCLDRPKFGGPDKLRQACKNHAVIDVGPDSASPLPPPPPAQGPPPKRRYIPTSSSTIIANGHFLFRHKDVTQTVRRQR